MSVREQEQAAMQYERWLAQCGERILHRAGVSWRIYRGALVPATPFPCFVAPESVEARRLLRESGAALLRFSAVPKREPTEWWYMVSDSYDRAALSPNMRNKIRRGHRSCRAERVTAEWLAGNGYGCYRAAFSRYRGATPQSEPRFREALASEASGPFEHWAVFADEALVGYSSHVVEGDQVALSVTKFDPAGLKERSAYAFFDTILTHYVAERGFTVNNGNRAVSHDTNMQDFLLQFGFRRLYARLCVAYRPWLAALVWACFPARNAFRVLPGSAAVHRVRSLLYQEELRRRCECA